MGAGGFIAGMSSGFVRSKVDLTPLSTYAKESAGVVILILGSLLMGTKNRDMKQLGTGIATSGGAIVFKSVYNRFAGQDEYIEEEMETQVEPLTEYHSI